jgi:hypothetical protein
LVASLDNDAALILWLTGISKDLCLKGRDVMIELLELCRERTCSELFAGLVVQM